MDKFLYTKELVCVVCSKKHETCKVRIRKLPVEKKDSDFHIWYKDVNPVYYNVWVCPNCGLSVTESEHIPISTEQKSVFLKSIGVKWTKRDFSGERTYEQAVESHQLALLTGQVLNKSNGYLGGLCLRLAWLFREYNDSRENQYLKHALDHLEAAYSSESFPIAGLDEISLSYLIGELKRMLGSPKEAIFWFSRALGHPDIKNKRLIQRKARDQWQTARDAYREEKEITENESVDV